MMTFWLTEDKNQWICTNPEMQSSNTDNIYIYLTYNTC